MTAARLKTEIWIQAQIRLCDLALVPAVVARRGDADAGQVLIKRNRLDGSFEVYGRTVAPGGDRGWRCLTGDSPVGEDDADAAIARETRVDPDMWVLEIEDAHGRYELDGPLV